jgi:mono/diheme cytochrome c family protein
MRKKHRYEFAALCLASVALTVASTDRVGAADAYQGGQIARRWCEPCHVVAPDQQGTTGEAPPFAEIARRPGFDAAQIAMFLLDPHPKMPNMSLTRIEAGDLAAYIATLRR